MKASKALFFEKKKQKTFIGLFRTCATQRDSGNKSFLVLFFNKGLLPSLEAQR